MATDGQTRTEPEDRRAIQTSAPNTLSSFVLTNETTSYSSCVSSSISTSSASSSATAGTTLEGDKYHSRRAEWSIYEVQPTHCIAAVKTKVALPVLYMAFNASPTVNA